MKINFKGVFSLDDHIRILKAIASWQLDEITIISKNNQFFYQVPGNKEMVVN